MKKVLINEKNIEILKEFINDLGKERLTFRYYDNRDISVIKNHLVTIVLTTDDNEFIGYGHLDKEDKIIWLGIVILEKFQKRGYGYLMLKLLLKKAKEKKIKEIRLSVDKNNCNAINLYSKFNFVKKYEKNDIIFLETVLESSEI